MCLQKFSAKKICGNWVRPFWKIAAPLSCKDEPRTPSDHSWIASRKIYCLRAKNGGLIFYLRSAVVHGSLSICKVQRAPCAYVRTLVSKYCFNLAFRIGENLKANRFLE